MTNTKPCEACGKPALVRQNRWDRTKFCSRACGARSRGLRAGANAAQQARERRSLDIAQPKSHRLIPLTRGAFAKVDLADFDLAQLNWTCTDSGYARRTIRIARSRSKNERLHRVIMERKLGRPLKPSEQVDHINGDRLDDRRSNLRVATHSQNSFNVRRKNSVGYMGVARNWKRYLAHIRAFTVPIYIGTFDTPEEAAWMRDQWALALHGEFANTNFDYAELPTPVRLGVPLSHNESEEPNHVRP